MVQRVGNRRDEQPPGRVTIREVAKLAGVAVGTVSRALNTPERASAKTRAAVAKAVDTLGYQVNAVARSMRTRATRAVALLVHDIQNPIFAAVAQAVQSRLADAGYLLVLTGSDGSATPDAALITMLHQRRIDGLIAFLRDEDDPDVAEALARFDGPVVLVDRASRHPADVVLSDQADGMRQATRHLIDLGHRRIGLITGAGHILPGRERISGYEQAHREAGVPIDREMIRVGSLQSDYGLRQTSILVGAVPAPTALIAGGNQLLQGMLAALNAHRVRIPEDVSIVGFDDTPLAALATPGITVVRRDVIGTGTSAAELLLTRLAEPVQHNQRRILLPTELIVRNSTAPL